MLSDKSGSYYEEYRRGKKREAGVEKLGQERLLTDRAAYISFLEVQLERVSAACMTAQGFSDRIEQVQAAVIGYEEKLNNVNRALRCSETQATGEASDLRDAVARAAESASRAEAAVDAMHGKVAKAETRALDLRAELDAFEARQQQKIDAARRAAEERLLELRGRLELEEARSRTNESRIASLGDLARAETQSALDAVRSQVTVRVDAVQEEAELRVSAMEERLDKALEHLKSRPVLPSTGSAAIEGGGGRGERRTTVAAPLAAHLEAQLREEIAAARKELGRANADTLSRVMKTLRELEGKVAQSAQETRQAQGADVRQLKSALSAMSERLARVETELAIANSSNDSLQQRLADLETATPPEPERGSAPQDFEDVEGTAAAAAPPTPTPPPPPPTTTTTAPVGPEGEDVTMLVDRLVQQAMRTRNDSMWTVLRGVEGKLRDQSALVEQSMSKVEEFMDVFYRTQDDLERRLHDGRKHQQRLSKLLGQSAALLDAEDTQTRRAVAPSPFKYAFEELEELAGALAPASARAPKLRGGGVNGRPKKTSAKQKKTKKKAARASQGGAGDGSDVGQRRRRRSLSADPPERRGSERPRSRHQRSRTPPPAPGPHVGFRATRLNSPHSKDGGGKRGRNAAMQASTRLRESLDSSDGGNGAGLGGREPLLAATPGPREGERPPWRHAGRGADSGYSSGEPAMADSLRAQRRARLKALYKALN